jgi:tetratricopeptide (TPR) repeat protein
MLQYLLVFLTVNDYSIKNIKISNHMNEKASEYLMTARQAIGKFEYQSASLAIKKAIKVANSNVKVLSAAVDLLLKIGKPELALKTAKKASSLATGDSGLLRNVALINLEMGKVAEAKRVLQAGLRSHPYDSELWLYRIQHCDISELNGLIDALKTQASSGIMPDEISVGYALGTAYRRLGDTEKVIDEFSKANFLAAQAKSFSSATQRVFVENIEAKYNAGALMSRHKCNVSDAPIFIVGLPRSGTTLVEQILSMHGDVTACGELNNLTAIVGNPLEVNLAPQSIDSFSQQYRDSVYQLQQDIVRFTDKKLYNFFYLGLLSLMMPEAKFVYVRRSNKDVAISCFTTPFSEGHEWTHDWGDIASFIKSWNKLFDHWNTVLGDKIHIVDYETLVQEPEPQVRILLQACALGWEPRCLGFSRSTRTIRTASLSEVRRPIFSSSVGKWKQYQDYLPKTIVSL